MPTRIWAHGEPMSRSTSQAAIAALRWSRKIWPRPCQTGQPRPSHGPFWHRAPLGGGKWPPEWPRRWARGSPATQLGSRWMTHGKLIAMKPAFGGWLVAEILCASPIQMATVRPGVLPFPRPNPDRPPALQSSLDSPGQSRLEIIRRYRDDDSDELANASVVIGVGQGVDPADYPKLEKHSGRHRGRPVRHPQGHRLRLDAPGPPSGHHRPQHQPPSLFRHRHEREVQPHRGRPQRRHSGGHQPRPRRSPYGRSWTSASWATGPRCSTRSSPVSPKPRPADPLANGR